MPGRTVRSDRPETSACSTINAGAGLPSQHRLRPPGLETHGLSQMRESSSVIICTRNRPDDIVRAVKSLLADESPDIVLIVVDQSDREDTALALRSIQDDRLRYLRSGTRGKGGALNEGLCLVRSQFVVCTDDDCEASVGWPAHVVQPMIDRPQVALVFSRVEAPEYDRQLGYIPEFLPANDRLLTRPRDICDGWGLGAGMAFRRDVVVDMGGVDRAFGPGGRFPSADDFDLELRLLIKGWHVYENSAAAHRPPRIQNPEGGASAHRAGLVCPRRILREGPPRRSSGRRARSRRQHSLEARPLAVRPGDRPTAEATAAPRLGLRVRVRLWSAAPRGPPQARLRQLVAP